MPAFWKKWTATIPASFLTALLLGVGFMGFVAWDQSHWWSTVADYGFGWLVPVFVGFVVYDRWPRIVAALRVCEAAGSPRAAGGRGVILNIFLYAMMAGGGLLFLVGALYSAVAGSSYPGTMALSFGMAGVLFPLLALSAPEPSGGVTTASGFAGDARVKLAVLFLFPVLVWMVSAPMVSVIEDNLSLFMLNRVTTVVFNIFDLLGLSIVQTGNVLHLPLGDVGVAEACSGIRSFTGCIFAGSFLAAVFLDKFWKKVGLVAAAVVFAFFTNLLRSLFLTSWAYCYGPKAMETQVHDIAGYAVLGLTVVGLMCLLPLFNLRFVSSHEDEPAEDDEAKK